MGENQNHHNNTFPLTLVSFSKWINKLLVLFIYNACEDTLMYFIPFVSLCLVLFVLLFLLGTNSSAFGRLPDRDGDLLLTIAGDTLRTLVGFPLTPSKLCVRRALTQNVPFCYLSNLLLQCTDLSKEHHPLLQREHFGFGGHGLLNKSLTEEKNAMSFHTGRNGPQHNAWTNCLVGFLFCLHVWNLEHEHFATVWDVHPGRISELFH